MAEAKAYSNVVIAAILDPTGTDTPPAPNASACEDITDASGFTTVTGQQIVGTIKNGNHADVTCNLATGGSCALTNRKP